MEPPLTKQRWRYGTSWGHVETGLPSRFWHSAVITSLAVKQLGNYTYCRRCAVWLSDSGSVVTPSGRRIGEVSLNPFTMQ